ncbi:MULTISPECIES: PaaI family thioesterase [Bacillaceae]|uniref:PaaI family thioesterase n=1 Tax=Bacillaceae TaxID=186817 RepID=UPI000BFC1075|nr:PaaI family thioesterase [Bacillus sp. AFS031507]PGY12983.1 phenylacetic acid degradation protein [Bacillus sp. AFS031507]
MFVNNWMKRAELRNSFDVSLGFDMIQLDGGEIILELPVSSSNLNPNGTLHGGVYASLLDIVMGVNIRNLAGHPLVTVNLNISYFATAVEGEKIIASAKILQQGYKIVSAEGEIRNYEGKLLAKGIGTFKILRS